MKTRRTILLATTAAVALSPTAGAQAAELRTVRCDLPKLPVTAVCQRLTVPEDHDRSGGRTIELGLVTLHSRARHPSPDPVLFLSGGPGESASGDVETYAASPWLRTRDVVLLDQRGTGTSRPKLTCPEVSAVSATLLAPPRRYADAIVRLRRATSRCAARWRGAGVDLTAYTSRQTALDVGAVRAAAGWPSFDVYAVSYGTRAALATMRHAPAGLRAVVLDSGAPPDEFEVAAGNLIGDIRGGIAALTSACGAQSRCARAFPDLGGTLDDAVDRLNRRPLRRVVTGDDGRSRRVEVRGDDVLAAVWQVLKTGGDALTELPRAIAATAAGDPRFVDRVVLPVLLAATGPSESAWGTQLSVDCADTGRGITRADDALVARPGRFRDFFLFASNAFCGAWGVPPVPADENRPVVSGIPTLLLSGTFDPISLPSQTRQAGAGLTQATFVSFPGLGHAVYDASTCARRITAEFFVTPGRPRTACARRLRTPVFTTG